MLFLTVKRTVRDTFSDVAWAVSSYEKRFDPSLVGGMAHGKLKFAVQK